MIMAKRTKIKDLLSAPTIGEQVNVKGWVRTKRGDKDVAIIETESEELGRLHLTLDQALGIEHPGEVKAP